jgi:hypothetical protein
VWFLVDAHNRSHTIFILQSGLCFVLGSLGCASGEFIFAAHLGFVEPKWFEEQQPLMLSFYYKIDVRII